MEDRTEAGLYLELTDRPIDEYADQRVGEVLELPGVGRATWWRNAHRDRADLPRTLDEFSHLGVYEVGPMFTVPSDLPDDIHGFHFVRTPRSGQGILTGNATIGLSLVLISPRDDVDAQALRDWGDFVHIRHIAAAAVPGYTMITPYINAVDGGRPRFMHFYEMDCVDPERAFKAMTPLVTERIGAPDTPEWKHWAHTPSLQINYVNTFERVGVRLATDAPATDVVPS